MDIYKEIENYTGPLLSERDKCCKEDQSDAAQPKDCIEGWKLTLDDARGEMLASLASFDKASKAFSNSVSWKEQLKKWKEDAEKAHEKAVEVYDELVAMLEAVDRTKAAETVRTVKSVLCLVKSILENANDLLRVSTAVDEPKGALQELKQYIECKDNLDASTKEKALGCITPFEEKMKLVNDSEEVLLTKLLEILHCASILVSAIDTPSWCGTEGVEEKDGLKWQLVDLRERISGTTMYVSRKRWMWLRHSAQQPSLPIPPCGNDCVTPKKPLLPIRQMVGVNGSSGVDSVYYSEIVELFEAAKCKADQDKKALDLARSKSKEASSYYKGLNDAIKAAEAAAKTTT